MGESVRKRDLGPRQRAAELEAELRLPVPIRPQPDDTTCGPTCLAAVYHYFGDDVPLDRVVRETGRLEHGGTLAVLLARHALDRGYRATIYTYNLQLFDPTWFDGRPVDLAERLRRQREAKSDPKLHVATDAYLEYLARGGRVRFEDLTSALLRRYLNRSIPILTGLSATYLYRSAREYGPEDDYDDVRGEPSGHFVVLAGYHRHERRALVADPLLPNPISASQYYWVGMERLIGAILLGIVTYDANLLVLEPGVR